MSSNPKKPRKDCHPGEVAAANTSQAEHEGVQNPVTMMSRQRFPADNVTELWLSVYDKLNDKDKVAFFRALPQWHDMVKSKKIPILFPEIAPALFKMPQNILLKLGELNKLTNNMVVRQAQAHPSNLRLEFEMDAAKDANISKLTNHFTIAEEIQKFMEDMKTHPGNPFPGRAIRLSFGILYGFSWKREACEAYWDNVILLLSKYGREVYYAAIELTSLTCIHQEYRFGDCLRLLPNLRKLDVGINKAYNTDGILREYSGRNHVSRRESLEALEMELVPRVLVNRILNFCCVPNKIKRLHLYEEDKNIKLPEAVYRFINLEVLEGSLFIRDLERLGSSPQRPPLKEVDLDFWNEDVTLQQVFMGLEPFGNTLVHLKMSSMVVMARQQEGEAAWRANLPNLKRLELKEYKGSLDFLVQLGSLIQLKIDRVKPHQGLVKRMQLVNFYGFEGRMQKSNIWGLMPSLLTVTVHGNEFKRPITDVSLDTK